MRIVVGDATRDGYGLDETTLARLRGAPHASPFAGRIVLEHVANTLAGEGCRALWLGMAPPLTTEGGADEHLFLGLLRALIGAPAAEASDQPPYAADEMANDVTRAPVYLVGRNGWGIEYVSALRDVSNLAA